MGRFWKHVTWTETPNGCWEVDEIFRSPEGYGVISWYEWGLRRSTGIHRVVCEEMWGLEPGQHVRHLCNNPPCINPAHLRGGSPAENAADREASGNTLRGERNGFAKLSEAAAEEIRSRYLAGATGEELAIAFGVAAGTIYSLLSGRTWRHLGDNIKRSVPRILREEDVIAIRTCALSDAELGDKYGVSPKTIATARNGHNWRSLNNICPPRKIRKRPTVDAQREIASAVGSLKEVAAQFGISEPTVKKYRKAMETK